MMAQRMTTRFRASIQDWLGHVSIIHTTSYTALSPSLAGLIIQRSGSPTPSMCR
jgi:hypothetical protein